MSFGMQTRWVAGVSTAGRPFCSSHTCTNPLSTPFRPGVHSGKRRSARSSLASPSNGRVAFTPTAAAQSHQAEFAPYRVIKKGGGYDLRLYDVYPIVEMDYERREEGYLNLGQYFDGGNDTKTWYRMTAPVVMRYYPGGRKVMQMYVGSHRGADKEAGAPPARATELPAPSDPSVRLSAAGGELLAVRYFDGAITPQTAAYHRQQLIQALEQDGLKLAEAEQEGYFRVGQYGQVYTLETRVNEMLLQVEV